VAVVALQPRQKTGAQEGGLAGARGAEDHEQSRGSRLPEATQLVEGSDDRAVALEEDAGVIGFERS
jgi:hypothetical protein